MVLCKDELLNREQFWLDLDTLSPEYNISEVASSIRGLKWNEASKGLMSKIALGRKINPFLGKVHRLESKLLMTNSKKRKILLGLLRRPCCPILTDAVLRVASIV